MHFVSKLFGMRKVCGESYKYEIREYLGEGGSGRVYKAFRYSLAGKNKEVVALKFLKTEKSIQELISEYAAIQNLRSTYALKVFGVENIDGKPTLVMEYIEGITWHRLFCEELSASDKSYLLSELINAIHSLREEISFHGDLSPFNIMIDSRGKLRLIDFGNHYSDNRVQFVTPEFVTPDILRGEHSGADTDLQVVEKIRQKYHIESTDFSIKHTSLSLASRIQHILSDTTKQILRPRIQLRSLIPSFVFICFFLLLVPIQAKPPVQSTKSKEVEVLIRSKRWKHIRINGRDYGYTPVHTRLISDRIFVEWEAGGKKGRISKSIDSDSIQITDRDFIAN